MSTTSRRRENSPTTRLNVFLDTLQSIASSACEAGISEDVSASGPDAQRLLAKRSRTAAQLVAGHAQEVHVGSRDRGNAPTPLEQRRRGAEPFSRPQHVQQHRVRMTQPALHRDHAGADAEHVLSEFARLENHAAGRIGLRTGQREEIAPEVRMAVREPPADRKAGWNARAAGLGHVHSSPQSAGPPL